VSTHWEVVRDTLVFSQGASTSERPVSASQLLGFSESVALSAVRATLRSHWPRWIVASVARHFDARRQGLLMFIEGENHEENVADYVELRVDGPFILELSRGYFKLIVEVNVFVISARNDEDLYKIYRDCGTVAAAFTGSIDVFKLGDGVDDDQSLLGCLVLIRSGDQREALRVSHFGQISAVTPILRSSVEGHYHMELRE
jgi:hypothetical protein